MGLDDWDHGDLRKFFAGCRCEPCMDARRKYQRHVRRQKAYGTWQPMVEAEPVRQHVQRLMAAYACGTKLIARQAGVHNATVQHLVGIAHCSSSGRTERIRPMTAERLMAVRFSLDGLPDTQPIAAAGSLRRVQALGTLGWPQHRLSQMYPVDDETLKRLVRQARVTVRTAREIRLMYAELLDVDPIDYGLQQSAVTRVIRLAARKGWAPPHCWDDRTIDDPGAIAEWTGVCGTREGHSIHRRVGIPYCEPCKAAEREYRADIKRTRLARRETAVGG